MCITSKIPVKRVRIFAGPNGSGKSSLRRAICEKGIQLGKWINADDLLVSFRANGDCININDFLPEFQIDDLKRFYESHALVVKNNFPYCFDIVPQSNLLHINDSVFSNKSSVEYVMSVLSDYLRTRLLQTGESFSFETVFSHKSKLEFIHEARKCGYRIYLYFVCTQSPELCIARVKTRVKQGGHDVSDDKICERYHRCLGFLCDAIKKSDRAYLFDNSDTSVAADEMVDESSMVMEIEQPVEGMLCWEFRWDEIPNWIANSLPFEFK